MLNHRPNDIVKATIESLSRQTNSADQSPSRQRFMSIYNSLRVRITLLHFPPGARLDLDALALEFKVSRTPIRSVLQRLEHEGLAVTRHGVGTIVTEIDVEQIRRVMQLRIGLAELVGSLSPNLPDEALFQSLEDLQNECNSITEELTAEKMASIDIRLHACKCQLIGNEVLHDMYDELYHRTTRLWFSLLPQTDIATEFKNVSDDVNQTLSALRRGDVKAAGFITRNKNSAGLIRMDEILHASETKMQIVKQR
jgi:DNA-binding GntR family transcriptional regulator